jgi:uncharacterized membrane protein AbrB (regulator of aidB expression)
MRQMKIRSQGKWYWRVDFLGWSLACAIAWAAIWVLVATLAATSTVRTFAYVFLGWVIGWGMATLARVVYPMPKWTLLTREDHSQTPGQ